MVVITSIIRNDTSYSIWVYHTIMYACKHAKSLQLCPTLCESMDCSLPGSSVRRFSRQEYWSGLPSPPLGDLTDLVIEPRSLMYVLYYY